MAGGLLALATGPAAALEFSNGELTGSFDTTITLGANFRVADRDDVTIGWANGGTRYSINGDDGNLNYDRGLISLAGRATHELSINYRNVGAFARATYFYDVENAEGDTEFRDLDGSARAQVGRDFELLDAYFYAEGEIGEAPTLLRIGSHVLNWGESTFIQNGINVINPVDVGPLRVPGSEVRDALLPIPMISASISPTINFSLEAFYQLDWEETEIDAQGTYFSTNDFAGPGGDSVFLGFGLGGALPGRPNADGSFGIPDAPMTAIQRPSGFYGEAGVGAVAPRAPDRDPDAAGQFGIAARYYADLLGGTEFGAYFIRYHSRVPLISGIAGQLTDLLGITAPNYSAGARYFTEYPEDVSLVGLSFNTQLGETAMQGEVTYRWDQPLQIDDVEILQAIVAPGAIRALAAQGQAAGAAGGEAQVRATPGFDQFPPDLQAQLIAQGRAAGAQAGLTQAVNQAATLFNANQVIQRLGGIDINPVNPVATLGSSDRFFGQTIQGFERYDVWQAQVTATHAFGPMRSLGINQWVLLGEVGWTYVPDLPDQSDLLFEGPNTPRPGTATGSLIAGPFVPQQTDGFADDSSWGYRVAARFDMLNAIGPINLFPTVSFSHDVSGNTPSPIANFVEDRGALTLALRAGYLETWQAEVAYTNFFSFDNEERNQLTDRDFISISIKYSF